MSDITQRRYVVIDTETTGLDPDTDRVVEIALVTVNNGEITDAFRSYVKPGIPIPPEASAVHGITDEDVEDAPTLTELLPQINTICDQAELLVAHNASFDRSMLPCLSQPWLDTLRLAKRIYPDLPKHNNQYLRYALKIACPEVVDLPPHRALADAYVTSHLLLHLLEQPAVTQLTSPAELIKFSEQLTLQTTCTFGKHRGQAWSSIPRGYLQWLAGRDLDAETRFTVQHYLQ